MYVCAPAAFTTTGGAETNRLEEVHRVGTNSAADLPNVPVEGSNNPGIVPPWLQSLPALLKNEAPSVGARMIGSKPIVNPNVPVIM